VTNIVVKLSISQGAKGAKGAKGLESGMRVRSLEIWVPGHIVYPNLKFKLTPTQTLHDRFPGRFN